MKITFKILPSEGCEPNKQFFTNGLSCTCDSSGRWQDSECQAVKRGQSCEPGGVIQIGCSQCVCQANSELVCDDRICSEHSTDNSRRGLDVIGQWCTPFKSYFINCSICVCSASGKTSDAQCVRDTLCSLNESTAVKTGEKNLCLPKVTYLFPCLHCLCSEHGHFELNKCVEICQKEPLELVARCTPRKLYRKECNLCICPDDGIKSDLLCSKKLCPNVVRSKTLRSFQKKTETCLIHSFTPKRCIYCECAADGNIDEDACIESECLKNSSVNYGISKTSCTANEMVPLCSECFCLSNGTTNEEYCSRSCSYQSKLTILQKVVENSSKDKLLINRNMVQKLKTKLCHPNQVYLKEEKYCICNDKGVIRDELCTAQERVHLQAGLHKIQFHNFNVTCEPSTFVEFDCNTCFCSKKGMIDPKWCTYDDCETKKLVRESHRAESMTLTRSSNSTCTPGTISKEECNFCICSETGLTKDRACTKNHCGDLESPGSAADKFSCDPLSYYEVDCNICYCPRDGLKNVSNCTKNTCGKSFLRSNNCVPGQLFSDECNVCVCPPNGDKNDKACTNNSCLETNWEKELKKILPIGNQINEISISLDHCFPGEEYFVGCKLCVCPDMGLRSYATCNQMLCANEHVLDEDVEVKIFSRY